MNETVKINSLFNKTITGKVMQKIRGGLQLGLKGCDNQGSGLIWL